MRSAPSRARETYQSWRIPRFDEAFAEYLANLGPELEKRRQNFRDGMTTQIHVEKVGALEQVIKDYGLRRGGNEPYYSSWYAVERETAADFMAYLAASLGRLEALGYIPVTDRRRYYEPMLRTSERRIEHRDELTTLRLEILENILPAPKQSLTADQIWDFKNRHGRELAAFRRNVEPQCRA